MVSRALVTTSAVLCSFVFLTLLAKSHAHQAGSGWVYPPACCQGSHVGGDCEAIPSSDVTKGAQGYSVFIHPGDHHLATRYHRFFVPYGDDLPSGDENYHVCLHPTEDYLNCFFAPPNAV
ncbi:hypothetical protein LJR235_001648 [Pararhizobium sp. LjRoot235]